MIGDAHADAGSVCRRLGGRDGRSRFGGDVYEAIDDDRTDDGQTDTAHFSAKGRLRVTTITISRRFVQILFRKVEYNSTRFYLTVAVDLSC